MQLALASTLCDMHARHGTPHSPNPLQADLAIVFPQDLQDAVCVVVDEVAVGPRCRREGLQKRRRRPEGERAGLKFQCLCVVCAGRKWLEHTL